MNGPTNIQVMDERGHTADIRDRNGVMHVLSAMLAPSGQLRQIASND
jgi:uncharacterized surface protein with fasciclin (FAS1) repeats